MKLLNHRPAGGMPKAYARLQKLGIDPAGDNTAEAADDINDVRKSLGIDSMRRSSAAADGSHLAFSVARAARRIRRARRDPIA